MNFGQRVILAFAVLLGADIVHHMDAADGAALEQADERERRIGFVPAYGESPAVEVREPTTWQVEKVFTVWVPRNIGGRVNIAPVNIPNGRRVTVVRW